jgi:hypothetical protein
MKVLCIDYTKLASTEKPKKKKIKITTLLPREIPIIGFFSISLELFSPFMHKCVCVFIVSIRY